MYTRGCDREGKLKLTRMVSICVWFTLTGFEPFYCPSPSNPPAAEDAIKIDMLDMQEKKKGEKEKEMRNTRETRSRSRDAIRYMENVAMRAASRVGIVILHSCAR